MIIDREVIYCECFTLEHHFVLETIDEFQDDMPELYIAPYKLTYRGFFKRLWSAFKYVFQVGDHREDIHYDSTLINVEMARRIVKTCNNFIEKHKEWEEKIESEKPPKPEFPPVRKLKEGES